MNSIRPKTWAVTALAVAGGLTLLAVAVLVGPSADESAERKPRIVDAADLPMPQPLKPREGADAGQAIDQRGISLEQGAWVQVADEGGRLAQQYSASRIDPERDKRLRMQQPRAVFYPRDGRVITMRSERGTMRVPDRALESGRLEGNVLIRVYRAEGRMPDLQRDMPAMVVEADEALFDNRLGEIRCDRRVKVVTDELRFEGEGLTMLLLPDGRTIERLTVERPLSPIVVTRRVEPEAAASNRLPPGPPARGGPRAASAMEWTQEAERVQASQPYRLVLERNVQVDRRSPKGRTRIRGDRLTAVFRLEGGGLGRGLASLGTRSSPDVGAPGMLAWLGAVALAAVEEPETTEIRYEGRLTMNLTSVPTGMLRGPDDVLVEVDGTDVRVDDEASGARISGGLVAYETGREVLRVRGADRGRFTLASPKLDLEAESMELRRGEGRGRIEGGGRMRLGAADGAAVQAVASLPAEAAAGGGTRAATPFPASERTVRMSWRNGVDLVMDPGVEDSRLRQADFGGDVVADAGEVRLEAGRLVVDCVPVGGRDAVTRILAEGQAKAVRTEDGSTLAGRRVELALEPLPDGGSRPVRLMADGDVEALQDGQRLWTDAMECDFEPAATAERAELRQMRTRGNVEALVSGDLRVWAAAMDAEPAVRRVTLRGPELLLARGNALADGMSEVRMDDATGEGLSPGPGRCRYFLSPLVDAAPSRVPRPQPAEPPQMEATWKESMKHRRVDEATGLLQLAGEVEATASRTPRERDDLRANEVMMWMTRQDGQGSGQQGGLRRVRAVGGVRIESRAWSREDRSDEPRLLRLVAEDVAHDVVTGEADVASPGTLLVFDRDDEGVKGPPSSLFDGRGTTRFRWSKAMAVRRIDSEGRYRIVMADQAELVHAGLRPQDTLTITSDVMEAQTLRRDGGPEVAAAGQAPAADLGGAMKLERVVADGRVLVRSPEADVECDRFDYDLATRIATLTARPGRVMTVLQKGRGAQPIPLRAESALWDLENGSIRVIGAVGTGVR